MIFYHPQLEDEKTAQRGFNLQALLSLSCCIGPADHERSSHEPSNEDNVQDEQIDENKETTVDSDNKEDKGNVVMNEQGDDDEWENESEDDDDDEEGWDHCYAAFKPEVQILSNVRDSRRTRAIENNQDPNMFAVIDGEYEYQGTFLMGVSAEEDFFSLQGRCCRRDLEMDFH